MTPTSPDTPALMIRQIHRRDLEVLEQLMLAERDAALDVHTDSAKRVSQLRRWFGLIKGLSLFPNPLQHLLSTYVAEQDGQICGVIQVSPFNHTRSTWQVDQIALKGYEAGKSSPSDVGSQLLRHCLQAIWEARTWMAEVNVNEDITIALCRQTGFQPLAHRTYWAIAPELLAGLTEREPDLPNLLPVSNADACLLYQLDTVSMPPQVRQVYDRHLADFRTSMVGGVLHKVNHWFSQTQSVSGYVFEPQRKAAIGYFQLQLCKDGSHPHEARLTVHPAYTWLYPELFCQMARVAQAYPEQSLQVMSSDYQPEREEYLTQMGAVRVEHTLLMSRSVWHKVKESRPLEGLQLPEVLQNLQPARKPVPSRFLMMPEASAHLSSSPTPAAEPNRTASSSSAPEDAA